ncbi:MAG: PAS domain S-box protein [Lunatimonas sp.]|uniref:sensor histidine kinase n=1 Tax=Lunatimonas sp. TaxID=2060141 RepID=UPI00263B7353|nr:PAS domain-containing sensor histidine kinase [Lunatimonas sp.]MCC5937650.1 PAS domain S-box protein [Lunatimonas sp.]
MTLEFDLDIFFQQSPDLLCIAGFDGYFRKLNPSWTRLMGYSEHELLENPIDSFVFQEDSVATVLSRDHVRYGKPLVNFENRYLTKTGRVVWLSWTSFPVPEKRLIYAIAKDISLKKQQETDRNIIIEKLGNVIEEMKQANYTASHDLRSPVNNMLSIFELLDQSKVRDEETEEFLEMMRLSTTKLKETLDHYLTAFGQGDRLKVQEETVYLPQIVEEVVMSVESLISSSGAAIAMDFSAWEAVSFNRLFMYSILLNLLTNAVKYRKVDEDLRISISTRLQEGKKELVIRDNGIGFDMEVIQGRLFGFRQKFSDHPDSNGIGLYLVYNHVTALGGKIRLNSRLDEGAEFIITFR